MIYNVNNGGIVHYTCIFETQDLCIFISYNEIHRGLLINIDVCLKILCGKQNRPSNKAFNDY